MAAERPDNSEQVMKLCREFMEMICAQQPRMNALEASEMLDSLRISLITLVVRAGREWMEVELVTVEEAMKHMRKVM